MYPNVHRTAMSTIAKLWKEPSGSSRDEWLKKMWSIYTVEYHSAIRRDEYLSFASTWMELEVIMLSEVCQAEKANYVPHIRNSMEEIRRRKGKMKRVR